MKNAFERMNAHIVPDEHLDSRVLDQAVKSKKPKARFRPLIAVAAMLVLILSATPIMAARIPMVNDLLYTVSPELAEKYAPVQLSASANGITMEIVAAKVTDAAAEFVLKIEGEALANKTVAPILTIKDYHGYTHTDGESLNDYEGVQEDREKGIWYFQYVVTYHDGTPVTEILRDNITVKLSGVDLSDLGREEGIEVPVIFTDYEQITVKHDRALYDYGFSRFGCGYGDEAYADIMDQEEYVLMTPGESVYDVTDKLALTGAAYIDGKLHVQMAATDCIVNHKVEWDYWRPYFVDAQGNKIRELYHNSFAMEHDGHETEYTECVYDIPEAELENYTMVAALMDFDAITAHCQVTFRISDLEYTTE